MVIGINKKSNRGMVVFWVLLLISIMPVLYLAFGHVLSSYRESVSVANKASSETVLETVVVNIIRLAADADNDGHYELLRPVTGDAIPLQVTGKPHDVFGTPLVYYAWDSGNLNSDPLYTNYQSSPPPQHDQLGRIISAGEDKIVETGRDDVSPVGDDVVIDIFAQDLEMYHGGVVGWIDSGEFVRLIEPNDKVSIHGNADPLKLSVDGALKVSDANTNTPGTLSYDSVGGTFLTSDNTQTFVSDIVPAPEPVNLLVPELVVSGTRTLHPPDYSRRIRCINAGSDYVVTLTNPTSGYVDIAIDSGVTHFVTITSSGGTINGEVSRKLRAGEKVRLLYLGDGEWSKVDGLSVPLHVKMTSTFADGEVYVGFGYHRGRNPTDAPRFDAIYQTVSEQSGPVSDYVNFAAGGPNFTAPRSGVYFVNFTAPYHRNCHYAMFVYRDGAVQINDNGSWPPFSISGVMYLSEGQEVSTQVWNDADEANYKGNTAHLCYAAGFILELREVPEW